MARGDIQVRYAKNITKSVYRIEVEIELVPYHARVILNYVAQLRGGFKIEINASSIDDLQIVYEALAPYEDLFKYHREKIKETMILPAGKAAETISLILGAF